MADDQHPLVSVIIPAYNSEKTLWKCLESVKAQTYRKIETLVVDRHSTDRTAQIAEKFGARLLFVTRERGTAKNYAAKKARGDFLLFVDSDMMLSPRVIEDCVAKCRETGADAITIPLEDVSQSLLSTCRKLERKSLTNLTEFMEAPRFIRKKVFLDLNGFDENLVCGEDYDLTRRLKSAGCKIDRVESELLHFEEDLSLYNVVSKSYYYGKTLPALVKKEPKETVERYLNIRFESVKTAGISFRNLKLLLGFAAMKILELIGYTAGVFSHVFAYKETRSLEALKNKISPHKTLIINLSILTLTSIIVFRNFLFTDEWPAGGDVLGFISRAYLYGKDFRWLYVWRPISFGFVEGVNSMDFFLMVLYWLVRDPSWTVKIFLFLLYLTAALYSSTSSFSFLNPRNLRFLPIFISFASLSSFFLCILHFLSIFPPLLLTLQLESFLRFFAVFAEATPSVSRQLPFLWKESVGNQTFF
ncbi:glycosyltransferase [Candidatus Bathyarchaeota archaeon]|nr:glycosyltransferase [Candidatus Bathyarchaeota archaeon]